MSHHNKRYQHTIEFLKKVLPAPATILDLGTRNTFSEIMEQHGYTVINTEGEDLDVLPDIVKQHKVDAVTAFEIFEHLIAPFNVLRAIESTKIIATIPLNLWFTKAYQSKTDEWDRHYHEFEDWQFDWLLNKSGWDIKKTQKWTSPIHKIGFRPILRRYTPRYYAVYAEKKERFMRIGMILDKTFPPDPRVENEAVALINSGHQVFLFCLTYDKNEGGAVINKIEVKRYLSNKLEYKLSALVYTFPFYTWLMRSKINDFLVKNMIDAIHIHDIRIAEAVFKANLKLNLPVVLDLHDNMPEIMKLYPHLQKFPGKQLISPLKWKKKEEAFIQKVDKVITVSQEFIDEVVERTKISKNKIVLVPNTVQKSFYEDAIINRSILEKYKKDFVILYLGDTGLRRGLQTAIAAIALLKNKIKNIKLVIVGKNSTDTVLKEQVKRLKIENLVDFEGWQNVALFPSYIQSSSVCISPLHRNIQHDVAYANKLFQYMSFSKPVLVSNAIAQKNLIERTNSGLVHLERDSDDFSKKVLSLYQDSELCESLGENGKQFIEEEFCWEKTSKKLIKLYDELEN